MQRIPPAKLAMILTLGTVMVSGCVDRLMVEPARMSAVDLSLSISYAPDAEAGPGWGAAYDAADQVWIQLSRAGTAFHEQTMAFAPGDTTGTAVSLEVELAADQEEILVSYELRRGAEAVFRGDTTVVAEAGGESDAAVVLGAVAAVVDVVPLPATAAVGDTVSLQGVALFVTGDTVTTALTWSVLDPDVVKLIDGDRVVVIGPGTARVRGSYGEAVAESSLAVALDLSPVPLSGGYSHMCVVGEGGGVSCWGANWSGQLGSGVGSHYDAIPVAVAASATFASVAGGADHSCGLTITGEAYCWGSSHSGQVGNGRVGEENHPPSPVSGGLVFSSLAAGSAHSCGVTVSGPAYCWGRNTDGQLGTGSNGESAVPVAVTGALEFTAITTGLGHSCGLTTAGDAYCWGLNESGQLGDGTSTSSGAPVLVDGGLSFIQLTAGEHHTCGLAASGTAYCWGRDGMLGTGTWSGSATPAAVVGGHVFTQLASRRNHTCGLKSDGSAHCWGNNGSGELGDGTRSHSIEPTPVAGGYAFIALAAGAHHSCGMFESGAVQCWGLQDFGRLGDGSTGMRTVPVPVQGGIAFQSVDPGHHHFACGVGLDSRAYCWGQGSAGRLGINDWNGNFAEPMPVAGGLLFRSVRTAWDHVCGVTTGDLAYCWGAGGYGEIGDGMNESRAVPQPVSGGQSFGSVVVGRWHSCGLTTAGQAYCWGRNAAGELGDGTTVTQNVPVAVSGGLTFTALATAHQTTCGLTAAGEVYCWGENDHGELGTGSSGGTSATPVRAALQEPLTSLTGSTWHFCGLTSAGDAYCWGSMGYGPQPTALHGGERQWQQLDLGEWTDCGIALDGQALCWGGNHYGQFGDGTYSTGGPAVVSGSHQFQSMSAGRETTCGVATDGAAFCWGRQYLGGLGDGSLGYSHAPVPVTGLP